MEHIYVMEKVFAELKHRSVQFFANHETYVSLPFLVWQLIKR